LLGAGCNGPERRYREIGDELASSHGAAEGHAQYKRWHNPALCDPTASEK
jgi:hypothetical protein